MFAMNPGPMMYLVPQTPQMYAPPPMGYQPYGGYPHPQQQALTPRGFPQQQPQQPQPQPQHQPQPQYGYTPLPPQPPQQPPVHAVHTAPPPPPPVYPGPYGPVTYTAPPPTALTPPGANTPQPPMALPLANASASGAASIPYPSQRQYDTSIPGGLPGPKGDYVAELGRASWKVLHACAEQFPPYPTPQEQQAMLMFVHSFAQVYPCIKCRIHFQQSLQQYPPDVSNQAAFVKWMSLFHDQVNASIGKPNWKQQPPAPQ